ncbi:hypothetical protein FDECE_5961 [Fusarium decemcellulare]|nr:hypothetical protein FDECE_5961 [Fusarium decemcellulare]
MPDTINLSKPDGPIHVGVVLMGGVTEILDVAPIDMIMALSKGFLEHFPDEIVPQYLKSKAIDFQGHWVSMDGEASHTQMSSFARLLPTNSFSDCPPLEIVLVGAHFNHTPNEAELAFVRKCYDDCAAFLSICGGVEVPRLAGILEGKTATGPRGMLGYLRHAAPGTNWVEKRWVRDGKLWTSGTFLNGTDMVHNFVKETWGKEENGLVATLANMGAWPDRDVDYRDVDGETGSN